MKPSPILCASVVALAALALVADGAFAATTVKSGKSNSSEKMTTATTRPAPVSSINLNSSRETTVGNEQFRTINPNGPNAGAEIHPSLNSSRSNTYRTINSGDPKADQACTAGGGKVGKNAKGQDACITSGIAVSDPGVPNK